MIYLKNIVDKKVTCRITASYFHFSIYIISIIFSIYLDSYNIDFNSYYVARLNSRIADGAAPRAGGGPGLADRRRGSPGRGRAGRGGGPPARLRPRRPGGRRSARRPAPAGRVRPSTPGGSRPGRGGDRSGPTGAAGLAPPAGLRPTLEPDRPGRDRGPPSLGFRTLSCYGPRPADVAAPRLRQVNTHVDPVRWRDGRRFLGAEASLAQLRDHLAARRRGAADPGEPRPAS